MIKYFIEKKVEDTERFKLFQKTVRKLENSDGDLCKSYLKDFKKVSRKHKQEKTNSIDPSKIVCADVYLMSQSSFNRTNLKKRQEKESILVKNANGCMLYVYHSEKKKWYPPLNITNKNLNNVFNKMEFNDQKKSIAFSDILNQWNSEKQENISFSDDVDFKNFISFLKKGYKSQIIPIVTEQEKVQIKARKLWSDVVSETDLKNKNDLENNTIKKIVLERLKKCTDENDNLEYIYNQCINFLKKNSVITVTFNSNFLNNGLRDFQLLNMWEKDNRSDNLYSQGRKTVEESLFKYLSPELNFTNNIFALPRYGSLQLLANNSSIKETSGYGNSFIVLKDIAKLNALYYHRDSLNSYYQKGKKAPPPCTFHNLELLLSECSDKKLSAIVKRVKTGAFPTDFNQNFDYDGDGYIEVLLPAFDISDPNIVEHVHIDSGSYTIPHEVLPTLQKRGISISNAKNSPYEDLEKQFINAIKSYKQEEVEKLLNQYPSLVKIIDHHGYHPILIAAEYGNLEALKVFQTSKFEFEDNAMSLKLDRALWIASLHGKLDIVAYLVAQGINVNIASISLSTPLHSAAWKGHVEVVCFLLKNGADPNLESKDGATPLILARNTGHAQIVELLTNAKTKVYKSDEIFELFSITDQRLDKIKNNSNKIANVFIKNFNKEINKNKESITHNINFQCPILRNYPLDPVILPNNPTIYERENIENYVRQNYKNPVTNEPVQLHEIRTVDDKTAEKIEFIRLGQNPSAVLGAMDETCTRELINNPKAFQYFLNKKNSISVKELLAIAKASGVQLPQEKFGVFSFKKIINVLPWWFVNELYQKITGYRKDIISAELLNLFGTPVTATNILAYQMLQAIKTNNAHALHLLLQMDPEEKLNSSQWKNIIEQIEEVKEPTIKKAMFFVLSE